MPIEQVEDKEGALMTDAAVQKPLDQMDLNASKFVIGAVQLESFLGHFYASYSSICGVIDHELAELDGISQKMCTIAEDLNKFLVSESLEFCPTVLSAMQSLLRDFSQYLNKLNKKPRNAPKGSHQYLPQLREGLQLIALQFGLNKQRLLNEDAISFDEGLSGQIEIMPSHQRNAMSVLIKCDFEKETQQLERLKRSYPQNHRRLNIIESILSLNNLNEEHYCLYKGRYLLFITAVFLKLNRIRDSVKADHKKSGKLLLLEVWQPKSRLVVCIEGFLSKINAFILAYGDSFVLVRDEKFDFGSIFPSSVWHHFEEKIHQSASQVSEQLVIIKDSFEHGVFALDVLLYALGVESINIEVVKHLLTYFFEQQGLNLDQCRLVLNTILSLDASRLPEHEKGLLLGHLSQAITKSEMNDENKTNLCSLMPQASDSTVLESVTPFLDQGEALDQSQSAGDGLNPCESPIL